MENRHRVEPGLFHLLLVRVRSRRRRLDLLRSPLTDTKVSRDLVEIDTAIDEALLAFKKPTYLRSMFFNIIIYYFIIYKKK